MAKQVGSAADPLWYKDATISELHFRSFKDINADGIGDFPGLIQLVGSRRRHPVEMPGYVEFPPSPISSLWLPAISCDLNFSRSTDQWR